MSAEERPHDQQLEKFDLNWGTRQSKSGRGYLPNLETILYAERGKVVSEQGVDRCLERDSCPVQTQRDSVAAALLYRTFIQVT